MAFVYGGHEDYEDDYEGDYDDGYYDFDECEEDDCYA
ncbi:hypothetical protein SAMN05421776_11725 [Nocardia farcinica]|uniref:Uncharacterized protein n=1 Tax=Nocardia farcinica TaxID=37329 RepID=A0A0H5NVL8_NOCFR|nr:hypothetical protein CJ469_05632 [Nocardia farcinica]PFX06070.1 hypothetical protein CJ468_04930 [Nocardia farcinica]CRY79840.1 Uncharacterised protein [Nocardia farcinica]SIT33586.1 hypothetical protein SAMN05421776_11725 [Nocardia farcinica]